jgi:2,4-dienoyl-CoA reductase-like NADH-dependent reductase (Old Yellow Enzyme family)
MEKSLFDQVRIGKLAIANRLVRSATWEGMCDDSGAVTPRLIDYYRELTRGGVGLIISGYTYVREDGQQLTGKMGAHDDSMIAGLTQLTTAVHNEGGIIFCQLVHVGAQTSSKVIGTQPLAPSAIEFASYGELPKALSTEDIRQIVQAFGKAASRCQQAGFDGIQLHGAHGYLINQFLSPLTNQRADEYGGPLENRMRFLLETYQTVRASVGADFPVTIKLTAADHLPGGFTPEEAQEVARRLDELGIDAIEVSSGTPASGDRTPARTKIDSPDKEAYNADLAKAVKQAVKVPVMTVGGLRSCAVMQRLLHDGSADLFALSRPLIREPDLPCKWQQDENHIATCISCNGCFKPGLSGKGIYCVIDRAAKRATTQKE